MSGSPVFTRILNGLHRTNPGLAVSLDRYLERREQETPQWEPESTRSGEPTIRLAGRLIHSSVNPRREAERLAGSVLKDQPDAVVVFGLGLGYHLEALRTEAPSLPTILVEPSPSLLRNALESLSPAWWHHFGPDLVIAPDEQETLTEFLNSVGSYSPALLLLQAMSRHYEEESASLDSVLDRYRRRRGINRNTLRRFGKLWVRNTLRNLPENSAIPGITSLENSVRDRPAIVCGAGPTLDTVLPYLPYLSSRAVIIAVDTAIAVLQRIGVQPHLAVVADPQYWNTRHLDHVRSSSESPTILVAEPATHPRVFRLWKGPRLLSASLFPLGAFIDRSVGRHLKLGAGGSVATSAWDLARIMGCSRIYLAGIDLGFPGNRTHCRGSFFEERITVSADRLKPAEQELFRYLHSADPYPVRTAGGAEILSDRRMQVYRSWFPEQHRRHAGVRTATLSSLSAEMEGIPFADAAALLGDLPDRVEPFTPREAIAPPGTPAESPLTPRELEEALDTAITEIESLSAQGRDLCALLEGRPGLSAADLAELDRIDQQLRNRDDRELAGFLAEEALEKITTMTVRTPRDAIEQARRLYVALEDSCRYHRELLHRYQSGNNAGDVLSSHE